MIGLIKKDVLFLKGYSKTVFLIVAMFGILGMTNNTTTSSAFYIPFIAVMMCLSTFNYDDYNKWDTYLLSMPVSRKTVVKSKYIFTIISFIIAIMIGIVVSLLITMVKGNLVVDTFIQDLGSELIYSFAGIAVFLSVMYPLMYKFGAEKGRIYLFVVVIVVMLIGGGIILLGKNLQIQIDMAELEHLFEQFWMILIPLLSALFLYISYRISYRIYQHKEF